LERYNYTIYGKMHNHGNSLVQSLAEPPEEGLVHRAACAVST